MDRDRRKQRSTPLSMSSNDAIIHLIIRPLFDLLRSLLIAHRSSLIAHRSSLIAHRSFQGRHRILPTHRSARCTIHRERSNREVKAPGRLQTHEQRGTEGMGEGVRGWDEEWDGDPRRRLAAAKQPTFARRALVGGVGPSRRRGDLRVSAAHR